ncbi:MAG: type II toxin-antitoxin system PemK/MazF family toxin [bacterium]|nr:type II toxin-antitoxin system PemK/MazF family toxin [bacterium]
MVHRRSCQAQNRAKRKRGKGAGNLPKNSKVKADQIRTLDKSRLVKLIGELGIAEIQAIDEALKIHLGL